MLPPRHTAVGFAPSSVATASGSALRMKKLLLSDVLLDSSPPLPFVPELDAVFCFLASLLEAEASCGAGERRGESTTMFTSSSPTSSSLSTAVLNSRSRLRGDRLQGCRLLGSSERWLLDSEAIAAFASVVFRVPFALQGRLVQDGINEPASFLRRYRRRRSFPFRFFQSLCFFRAMCSGGAWPSASFPSASR